MAGGASGASRSGPARFAETAGGLVRGRRHFAGTATDATEPAYTCWGEPDGGRAGDRQRLRRRAHVSAARLLRGIPGLLRDLGRATRDGDGGRGPAGGREPAVRAR